jgi:DNA-binding transcriptional LysR family regulator
MTEETTALSSIWNWLPTFRAVAETEHLPSAARRLHVTTPAVSRTVRLLEDHLGYQLFNRTGRSLVLNTAGQQLLGAVREAMGTISSNLTQILSDPYSGPIRISALGVLADYFVLPVLLELKAKHADLFPIFEVHRTKEANQLLERGHLDVAFYYEAVAYTDIAVENLGSTSASVYCGQGHPLFDAVDVTCEDVQKHAFSVPMIGDTGAPMDGWPIDLARISGMRITLLTSNLEICRSGQFLTVLPDVTAYDGLVAGDLRRLPVIELPAIEIFAARRSAEHERSSTVSVIEGVREQIEVVTDRLATV